jgi:hypothetical protein
VNPHKKLLGLAITVCSLLAFTCSTTPSGPGPISITSDSAATDGELTGTEVPGATSRSTQAASLVIVDHDSFLSPLKPSTLLFSDQTFAWESIPPLLRGQSCLRAPLGRTESLRYFARQAGTIYAALWTWDYGFLQHLPQSLRSDYNGWKKTGAVADIADAPEPYAHLPIYARLTPKGDGQLDLDAYVGQWVVVGFVPSPSAEGPRDNDTVVRVAGAQSRHNVVERGQSLSLDSSQPVHSFALYHDGARVASGSGSTLAAPTASGRYAMQVETSGGTVTIPLTVALPPAQILGWEKGFFPIQFYNGYSYAGLFSPNDGQRPDLETLAMFEMGANTFFQNGPHALATLLHARSILNVKSKTIPQTRKIPVDDETRLAFKGLIEGVLPLEPGTLGLYVEDEPPPDAAGPLSLLAEMSRRQLPDMPLLYTVQGTSAPRFWRSARSDVRMTRAYPVRKERRDDLQASIEGELSDFLSAAQEEANSTPLWLVAQAFGDPGIWDQPTPPQLRLMVNLALARGVRGLTYFCYDSSPRGRQRLVGLARWPFVPQSGLYEEVQRLNGGIARLHDFLASTHWVRGVIQQDRRFDVQIERAENGKEYAWITNWNMQQSTAGAVSIRAGGAPIRVVLGPGERAIVDLASGRQLDH